MDVELKRVDVSVFCGEWVERGREVGVARKEGGL
jgi:hypothetical protein